MVDLITIIFTADYWLIKQAQLVPLGITEVHLQLLLGLFGAVVSYFLLQPMIRLVVALQWNKLLTYIIGSLLFLQILGIVFLFSPQSNGVEQLANITLGIAIFGISLLLIYLTQTVISYIKQQRSKSV